MFEQEDIEVYKRSLFFVDNIDFSKTHLSNMITMNETEVFLG